MAAQAAVEAQQAAATAAQAVAEQRAEAESARRARLMAESRKSWLELFGRDKNGDKLPERANETGGGSGKCKTPSDNYLQGYNEPETKFSSEDKQELQKRYEAYHLPTNPVEFFPEIAHRIGMNWNAMKVEVLPYGAKVDSEGKDVSHLEVGGNASGFVCDRVNQKRYILCSERFLDGNKPYHDAVVAAHELKHAQVFNQVVEKMGGETHLDDARKYNNLCRSNKRCYARSEIDAQHHAVEDIKKLMPDMPQAVFDAEKKYVKMRRIELAVYSPENHPIHHGYFVYDFLMKNGKPLP